MGTLLLGIAIAVEVFFMIWSLVTKDRHDIEKVIVRTGSVVLLILLLLIGVLQGVARYGAFILILCIQALIGFLIWRKKKERPCKTATQIMKMLGNGILYTIVLFAAILFPQYKEPAVTGTHEVATTDYTWVDESRVETFTNTGEKRALTVRIWYPKEEGTYPLAVFSHGSFGVLESNTSTCMNLASNGYVAVSIAHPYHAAYVMDTNGKVTIGSTEFLNQVYADNGADTPEEEEKVFQFSREWMNLRTADENFVLDTILEKAKNQEEGPFQSIDTEHIGLFGHSMGGASSAALGRQRDDIDAVIVLEGTLFGEYLDFVDGAYVYNDEPYPIPLLDINSREIYDLAKTLPERAGVTYLNFYIGERAKDFREVVMNGASHMNFTDLAMVSPTIAKMLCAGTASSGEGTVNPRECIETINEVILEYFNYYLKGEGELNLQEEY